MVKNGKIKLNYVEANSFIPLTVENDIVIEAAFSGSSLKKGKKQTTLVMFTLDQGMYAAETHIFDDLGNELKEMEAALKLGDVKPFAVMRNAEVNNLDDMEGYGLPKLWNAIPMLKVTDLCYNVLFSDLDKAEKILLVNEILCEFDKNGKPKLTPCKANDEIAANAGNMAWISDLSVWKDAGKALTDNSYLLQLVKAFSSQTNGELKNITRTTGFKMMNGYEGIENAYKNELDKAIIKICSGTFSQDKVLRDTVHSLAQSGLRSIDFESGYSMQLDTAVRLAVKTGCHQLAGKVTDKNIEQTGEILYMSRSTGAQEIQEPAMRIMNTGRERYIT